MMHEHVHPLSHADVIGIVGTIDDDKIAEIIATGATVEEVAEAYAWSCDESEGLAKSGKTFSGPVKQVFEILTGDEDWPEEG